MIKYILISKTFEGFLSLEYNRLGYLVSWHNGSWSMTEDQQRVCLQNLGYMLSTELLMNWVKQYGYQLIKVERDLSYDVFADAYGMARDRYKAEPIWNKLSDEQRVYTLYNVEAYKRYLKRHPWMSQLMPKTYLANNLRDDWDKINTQKK